MIKIIALIASLSGAGPVQSQPAIQVEFAFDNRVPSTKSLPTVALQATRRQLIAGAAVPVADLRDLADFGDGLAAFHLARRLQAQTPPARLGVAAHYYAIAAYTGRAFAVPPLAALLVQEGAEYTPNLLRQALDAMTIQAKSGNTQAALLLGQMYQNGQPFGRDGAKAQAFLALAGQSDGQVALDLGILLMSDQADAAQGHAGAKAALTLAAKAGTLSTRVIAENLLRQIDTTLPIEKAAP
jgi:TPR repeat protein